MKKEEKGMEIHVGLLLIRRIQNAGLHHMQIKGFAYFSYLQK